MIKKEMLGELQELFIIHKKCEMVSERTVKDYQNHFRYFGEYLETRNLGDDITELDLKSYPLWMKEEKGHSVATINIRVTTFKCFLKWLYTEEYIQKDIASSIKKGKVDRAEVKNLSLAEQRKLIKCCRVQKEDSLITKRTKYFLMFIYYTGVRPQEVINMKIDDLDFREEFIKVDGGTSKTGQTRKIATWDNNLESLLRDIIDFNRSSNFVTPYLFLNLETGEKVVYATIRHNISKYKKKCGLRNLTAYNLRHTYAVNTQHIGVGNLKQVMGHKSIKSTEKYLNSTPEMVKDSFDKYKEIHPRQNYMEPIFETMNGTTGIFGSKIIEKDGMFMIVHDPNKKTKLVWDTK